MGGNALEYVVYYSNGDVKILPFESKWALTSFLHNEGDHVVEAKRFFRDEQHEEDYVR